MKKYIISISFLIVFCVGGYGFWYSFSRNQKIAHNLECDKANYPCPREIIPPSLWEIITGTAKNGFPNKFPNTLTCEPASTSTGCLPQNNTVTETKTKPTQQPTETVSFQFGSLTEIYTNKQFGFSFRYPKEINLQANPGECVYFLGGVYSKSAVLNVQTPDCSDDARKGSFEDYQKDFVAIGEEGTKLSFHLLSNDTIKTDTGIAGIYQKFSLVGSEEPQIRRRYVFKLPSGGFIIFLKQFDSPDSSYYLSLEQAIVKSLTFSK